MSNNQEEELIREVITTLQSARTSIKILSLPRLDNNVASNEEILASMDSTFEIVLAKAVKVLSIS